MARDLDALKRPQSQATYDRAAARRLIALLWPRDEPAFRRRFGLTIALMAGAAMLNAIVPLLFAAAVDGFSGKTAAAWLVPSAIIGSYVGLQWLSRVMNELRWSLYGPIEQRLQRTSACRAGAPARALAVVPPRPAHRPDQPHPGQRAERPQGAAVRLRLPHPAAGSRDPVRHQRDDVAAGCRVRAHPRHDARHLRHYSGGRLGMAACLSAARRRPGRNCARQGGRQPHQLRDGQVFRQRAHITGRYDRSLAEVERLTVASLRFRSLLASASSRCWSAAWPASCSRRIAAAGGRDKPWRLRAGERLPAPAHPPHGAAGPALSLRSSNPSPTSSNC